MPSLVEKEETQVRSVLKAFRILACFERDGEELSLADFDRRLGLGLSTAHRLASTLKQAGFLEKNGDSDKYRLGLKLVELSRMVVNGLPLRRIALPHLATLAAKSGANANLAILHDDAVLYLARVPSPRLQDTYHHCGRKAPLHCTALGKLLLAFLPIAVSSEILERISLTHYTPKTFVDRDELKLHLEEVFRKGFATDREEFMLRSHCIAVPVSGPDGVAGAISLSTTLLDMSPEELLDQLPHLLDAARATSYGLGAYHP